MNEAAAGVTTAPATVKLTERNLRNFWRQIDKNGPLPDQTYPHYCRLDRCWTWIGKRRAGYGRFLINRKPVTAHRISWEIAFGQIPEAMCVLHRCDNTACVNPAHLFIGTRGDNNRDKAAKGRARSLSGDEHHSRKNPECMARGDKSGARTHPEKIPRGENHGRRTKPERTARGEGSARAKITEDQARKIRARYVPGVVTLKTVAKENGLCIATIMQIVSRKTWRHVL